MFQPKLVLAPVDFSDPSGEALLAAADIATRFDAALLLVHVIPAIPKLPTAVSIFKEAEYEKRLLEAAESRVAELVAKYAESGISVRSQVGIANDVGMEILRVGEHQKADLIVIATHGMTGWNKMVFGSVAEKVVRLAPCAVLVLRPPTDGKR
jgi:nucleotide-binding universal stress UspA family protein